MKYAENQFYTSVQHANTAGSWSTLPTTQSLSLNKKTPLKQVGMVRDTVIVEGRTDDLHVTPPIQKKPTLHLPISHYTNRLGVMGMIVKNEAARLSTPSEPSANLSHIVTISSSGSEVQTESANTPDVPAQREDKSVNGQKLVNTHGTYEREGDPITFADMVQKFEDVYPHEDFEIFGDITLETACILRSTSDPLHLIVVRGREFIAISFEMDENGRANVNVGDNQYREHIEYSMLSTNDPLAEARMIGYLRALQTRSNSLEDFQYGNKTIIDGFLKVGFEWEFLLYDRSPNGLRLSDIFDKELLVGMVELDTGTHVDPVKATVKMAEMFVEQSQLYPDKLINSTSVPLGGRPQDIDVNVYPEKSPAAKHIAMINAHVDGLYPRTPESIAIRRKQALKYGYKSIDEMFADLKFKLWVSLATHINLGLPNILNSLTGKYYADFELTQNIANLINSELGAIPRMLLASSGYLTDIPFELEDIRDAIKHDAGTAKSPNKPIESAKHLSDLIIAAFTGEKPSSMLGRSAIAVENEDGSVHAMQHGHSRIRLAGTDEASGRVEYTAAGASSLLPKARAMAYLQMLVVIALVARIQKRDVLELAGEVLGISKDDVWGDVDGVMMDYNKNGVNSDKMQVVAERAERLIKHFYENQELHVLSDIKETALAGLKGLRKGATIHQFASGNGTLGRAQAQFIKDGLSGNDATEIIHDFQLQEAHAILEWQRQDPTGGMVREYIQGKRKFNYVMPEKWLKRIRFNRMILDPTLQNNTEFSWNLAPEIELNLSPTDSNKPMEYYDMPLYQSGISYLNSYGNF